MYVSIAEAAVAWVEPCISVKRLVILECICDVEYEAQHRNTQPFTVETLLADYLLYLHLFLINSICADDMAPF